MNVKAQRYELGVQLGASNLVGDVGRTNYIYPLPVNNSEKGSYGIPIYAGAVFRMNFNPHQTLRFNLGYANVYFSDRFAKENYRKQRAHTNEEIYGVTNNMFVGEALFEYNFFPVNNEQKNGLLSPYIFAGIGGMLYNQPRMEFQNDFNRDKNGIPSPPQDEEDFTTIPLPSFAKGLTLSIPFGAGLKYKFNYNWAIFGEFTFRPTLVDDIDFSWMDDKNIRITYNKDISDPNNSRKSLLQTEPYKTVAEQRVKNVIEPRRIGNPNSKDWINSISIGLTYSFGRLPCYCE